ncbi:phage tail protein [Aliivibrio fischeri]|uniref:phage tail-collar fiber domain-containing protein n=1 Tax=Aliivibrio fischeri TaxID=668 RepID=UPI00080E588D|nr:phage tail protein [Aliivibrio fischeri]OCH08097.1 hypothetical protein A6E09_17260 [Aliivibrio fischeri]
MTNLIPESEQQYGSVLTILGENAEQNGKLLNKQIEFTHIAFGDGNDTYVQPDRKAQGLVNELHRIAINSVDVLQATPDSVPILKVEAILPDDINDVVIREFAAVATFNGQSYFHAIGNCARVYVPKPLNNGNVSNPVTLEMTFVITSAEPIVEIDPNVITASREWVMKDGGQYFLIKSGNNSDITDLLNEPGHKTRLLPPGEFHIIGDVNLPIGVIGTGVNETKLVVHGKLRIHEKKQLEFGNLNMHVMNGGMLELGSSWEGRYRAIKFSHETPGECACTIQSGGNSWGSQDNIYEHWFFNRCGLLTDLQGYFNGNIFRKLTLFSSESWHRIKDSAYDCHGNMYESPIFQSAVVINEHKQPQNLLTPYIEHTDFQGLWNDMYSIQNAPFADPKSRDRDVINKTFSFSSLGYNRGEEIRIPFAPNVATVTEEEIKSRYSAVQIDIFKESTSVTGKAIRVTSPPGAYVKLYPFSAEVVSKYIRAFGAVTVSFDAKLLSGDGGNVTVTQDGNSYTSPNVRGSEWRRYSYTIGGNNANCGIYVSKAILGQIEFCNFSISSGRVGTQAFVPEYIKPFKNVDGEVTYQAKSEGEIASFGDDIYYGRRFLKAEGESALFKLWDSLPLYNYTSIRFRLIVDDSSYPNGLYVAEGLIVACNAAGGEPIRMLDFINEKLNGNGMEKPTVTLTSDGLSVAMVSGYAKIHLNIDYESTIIF